MSSRILPKTEATQAHLLEWRTVFHDPAGAPGEETPQSEPRGESQPGPTREEYQTIEQRLLSLERSLPQREQAARLAGRHEAEAEAAARWNTALEQAARSAASIASLRPRLRADAEQDVVRLSMAIARRILRRELTADPDALLGLVKAALEKIDMREIHKIRLRPEDAPPVSALLERLGAPRRVEVISDPSLERGAVLIEFERGQLDASVETQLEEITRGFTDLLERKRS